MILSHLLWKLQAKQIGPYITVSQELSRATPALSCAFSNLHVRRGPTPLRLTAETVVAASRCKHKHLHARKTDYRVNWGDSGGPSGCREQPAFWTPDLHYAVTGGLIDQFTGTGLQGSLSEDALCKRLCTSGDTTGGGERATPGDAFWRRLGSVFGTEFRDWTAKREFRINFGTES